MGEKALTIEEQKKKQEIVELFGIDVGNPVEVRRFVLAVQVYRSIVEEGMGVMEALDHNGVTYDWYRRNVRNGIFRQIGAATMGEIITAINMEVLSNISGIVSNQVKIARGEGDENNPIYPRDSLASAKWLVEEFVKPAQQHVEQASGTEVDFLKEAEKRYKGLELKTGEVVEVTTRISKKQDSAQLIDVTPEED